MAALEQIITSSPHPFPILFTHSQPPSPLSNHDISLSSSPSSPLPASSTASNIHLLLKSDSPTASTIAIVAHYDAVSASPSLASGSDANGSGLIALLSIADVLAKVHAASDSGLGSTNVLFVATAGGKVGFEGAKAWIRDSDPRLLRSIDLVICLDALGSQGDLTALSTPTKGVDPSTLQPFLDAFPPNAVRHLSSELDPTARTFAFEHQRFARKGFPALTLTTRHLPGNILRPAVLPASSIYDTADSHALLANTRTIAHALLSFILGPSTPDSVLAALAAPSPELAASWASYLEATPRFAPLLAANPDAAAAVVDAIASALAPGSRTGVPNAPTPVVSTFDFRSAFEFRLPASDLASPVVSISVYVASSQLLEFAILAAVLAYLFAALAYLVGTSSALAIVASIASYSPFGSSSSSSSSSSGGRKKKK